jgi:oligopeptide/dipeptide ABC transporter ATP-binding protein
MPALIELDGVGKTYGGRLLAGPGLPALHPISLRVSEDAPGIMAVVGESGSGKSTLGNILLGLLAPSTGTLCYRGRDIARLAGADRTNFRREVQAIAQDPFAAYNPFYAVDRALTVPIRKFGLAGSRAETRRLIEQACISVGLNPDDTLGRYPHQLSGGQRQRLMVARALLLRPRLLVADEPVSMVDASLRATILGNIAQLNRVHGIAVIYITHDIMTAYHVADTICVLYRGHLVEAGDAVSVIRAPQHPYTRLLVGSIPWPEPGRQWGKDARHMSMPAREATTHDDSGCPFLNRCPDAMPSCGREAPLLRRAAHGGAAACHLLEHAASLGSDEVAMILERNSRSSGGAAVG